MNPELLAKDPEDWPLSYYPHILQGKKKQQRFSQKSLSKYPVALGQIVLHPLVKKTRFPVPMRIAGLFSWH
jgi:hypothetical protein